MRIQNVRKIPSDEEINAMYRGECNMCSIPWFGFRDSVASQSGVG
jgi:hypothetical protein